VGYGSGLSTSAFTNEKTAQVVPRPIPSMRMAGSVNPGSRRRERKAGRNSLVKFMWRRRFLLDAAFDEALACTRALLPA
jgi:hypothetical protein